MTGEPLRVGICGLGRVYERLYAPALAFAPGLRLAAAADPSPARRMLAGSAVRPYESLGEMLSAGGLDAVAVLSPPRLHHEHTLEALAAGLPVLVEKPPAASLAELREWAHAAEGRNRVTVSFSRRYWARYRALKARLRGHEDLELVLRTAPGGWDAVETRPEDPAADLLPHLVDLARWLTRLRVVAVHAGGKRGPGSIGVELADGRVVECRAGHAAAYEEYVVVDGKRAGIGPPGVAQSALRRLQRRPDEDIRGFAAMLQRWEGCLRDGGRRGLPGYRDAWASVAALEAYAALQSKAEGGRAEIPVSSGA